MKAWNQSKEQIEAIAATGKPLVIVSGEGENGTVEPYTGAKTARAIKARLARERCGGDRWARLDTEDGMALAGVITDTTGAASALGRMGKGRAKRLTPEERERRRRVMAKARASRWPKVMP